MRRAAAVILVLGLTAGCTEGADEATTTVAPWTTAPWTTLPAPVRPDLVLGAGFEALAGVEAFCVTTELLGTPDFGSNEEHSVRQILAALGFAVVDEACPATLAIYALARRVGAYYTGMGWCWPGHDYTVRATLLIDGQEVDHWQTQRVGETPDVIYVCPGRAEPVEVSLVPLMSAFLQVFGSSGLGAWLMWFPGEAVGAHQADEDTVLFLSAMLYSEDSTTSDRAVQALYRLSIPDGNAHPAAAATLVPAVPHLVAYAARHPASGVIGDLHLALERLTGVQGGNPEEAWAWWGEQQP
jgi:hypothetical protein